jgi:hypothetical protein
MQYKQKKKVPFKLWLRQVQVSLKSVGRSLLSKIMIKNIQKQIALFFKPYFTVNCK